MAKKLVTIRLVSLGNNSEIIAMVRQNPGKCKTLEFTIIRVLKRNPHFCLNQIRADVIVICSDDILANFIWGEKTIQSFQIDKVQRSKK